MLQALKGHIAIITGGESGIGKAIAELFGQEGAKVAITYFPEPDVAPEIVSNIKASGSLAICHPTDVSAEDQVDALFDHCIAELGTPTILVNSAGINAKGVRVRDMTLERWNKVLSVNLTGAFLTCRRFARELSRLNCRGKVINISSVHEDVAIAGGAEYCASKGGLRNLTRCLALELAGQNVNVNCIAPGMVLTAMNSRAVRDSDFRKEVVSHIPIQRAATPEEVANLALFLASPASDYATGATFFLDGGLRLNLGQGA